MGIRFLCPACGKKINVKEHQAGLRGFCPKCNARIDIPLESQLPGRKGQDDDSDPDAPKAASGAPQRSAIAQATSNPPAPAASSAGNVPVGRIVSMSAAPVVDPLAEFPAYLWYVTAPGAAQPFGPADGSTMFQWLQEGRIAGTSLVWRQDWPEWRSAESIWPQLGVTASAVPARGLEPAATVPFQHPTLLPAPASAPLRAPAGPPATLPAAAGSAPGGAEIYYRRRSNQAYAATVIVLILLVLALGAVMYYVLTRKAPDDEAQTRLLRRSARLESLPADRAPANVRS